MKKKAYKSMIGIAILSTLVVALSVGVSATATTVTESIPPQTHSQQVYDAAVSPLSDFTVVNGVVTFYRGKGGDVIIPDDAGITEIGENAFVGNVRVTSIVIPTSVTTIGKAAFGYCINMTSVVLPDSVTSIEIAAFAECSSLQSITLPPHLTALSDNVFQTCKSLTSLTLPRSMTKIGAGVFIGCTGLTEISIPDGVTEISDRTFTECTRLTSIELPSGITSIGESAFSECTSLTHLAIPGSVSSIGHDAFRNCIVLSSLILPSKMTSIGQGTFTNCVSLTAITIPQTVTTIKESAFRGCINLQSIELPDSVMSIESLVFADCENLSTAKIPASVTSFGYGVFDYCNSLIIYGRAGSRAEKYSNVNSITFIPDGVTNCATVSAGTSGASISSSTMEQLVSSVTGALGQSVIHITLTSEQSVSTIALTIPYASFRDMSSKTKAELKISTAFGTIAFNAAAVDNLSAAATGDITITFRKSETSSLAPELQNSVGGNTLYQITLASNNLPLSYNGGSKTMSGQATISIPYTPKTNETDYGNITVFNVNGSGNLLGANGNYNPVTGNVDFMTNQLSYFLIAYNQVRFKDVPDDAWYYDAVNYVAARHITAGAGDGSFNPEAKLTRGQFIVMLMRAYGIEQATNLSDNFSDAGDSYYSGYLAEAKQLQISTGIGNNKFAPEKEITRQEMFTLIYNALKTLGCLPERRAVFYLRWFDDADQIASWSTEAFDYLGKAGVVSGDKGRLSPKNTSSRAEMAQVLYRLLGR